MTLATITGRTDRQTDRRTDRQTECDAICGPLLGRGGRIINCVVGLLCYNLVINPL